MFVAHTRFNQNVYCVTCWFYEVISNFKSYDKSALPHIIPLGKYIVETKLDLIKV